MNALEAVLDPTGIVGLGEDATLAARGGTLDGRTVGLLDNTKVNAKPLLEHLAKQLATRHRVGDMRLYTKDYFGTPVNDELLRRIVSECDVVITAVGDCGSCSAATVADGILFERAGMPAVSVCSDAFVTTGQAMARVQGFPGYDFLVATHPIASLGADQISQRAEQLVPGVERVLGLEA